MTSRCPNCHEEAAGLFTSDTGVTHCGCYYEGDPETVEWHADTETLKRCERCEGLIFEDPSATTLDNVCWCKDERTPMDQLKPIPGPIPAGLSSAFLVGFEQNGKLVDAGIYSEYPLAEVGIGPRRNQVRLLETRAESFHLAQQAMRCAVDHMDDFDWVRRANTYRTQLLR